MRIKTSDFPKFGKRNYAAIRRYFDSIKPWQSKYNPDNERPIGARACKLTSDGDGFLSNYSGLTAEDRAHDREGARFNKAMRMLDDESISFRLYDHDCVTYHPDETLTIHGYASVSTNDFINALTPMGISHSCRGKGRDNAFEPTLHLCPVGESRQPPDEWHDKERRWKMPIWGAGIIINCEQPVTLNYNVARRHWVPSDPESLEPFEVYKLDRRAAREVSREYHLATLETVINAVVALTKLPPSRSGDFVHFGDIMSALRQERFKQAIDLMPRGTTEGWGRRQYGTPDGIQPGFLRRLRDHIYDHEGVVERVRTAVLTPAQYERYKADGKRFDA
jgi:hypothetical protein